MKSTFIKLSAFMMALALSGSLYAQVPQKFNYQGIARDVKGNPMAQQKMSLKISVLPTSDAIAPEYEEIQTVTTNEFGLYTLQIGNGASTSLITFKDIKWETGNKYIKVAIDPKGGNDFVDAGTNQLLSVPYAIYADKAGVAKNSGSTSRATNNFIEKTNGSGVVNSTSQIYDNGTNIGVGTITPQAKLHLNNTSNSLTEIRVQGSHGGAGASSRISIFGDNSSSFSSTANYAVMNKQSSGMTGNYSPGFKNSKLFTFANSQGSMILNAGGNIGFGYFNQAAGTTTTRMFIDSLTGNVGINTTAPTAKLDVNGQIRIQGGSPGVGKVLTSDATGLATWQTPTGGSSQWITSGTNIYNNNGGRVGIGTGATTPKAKLEINTSLDTALVVKSSTANFTGDGILRAEYTGTNINDHVAIYGKSIPDSNDYYGVGVKGDGGYTGAQFTGTNKLLADPNGYNAVYGALLSGISDNNATYGSFSFAGQPYGSANVLGEKTASIHYAQGGEVNTGVNTSAISTPNTTAYGIYSTVSGDGNNVAGYFSSQNPDTINGVVYIQNENTDTSITNLESKSLVVKNNSDGIATRGIGVDVKAGFVGVNATLNNYSGMAIVGDASENLNYNSILDNYYINSGSKIGLAGMANTPPGGLTSHGVWATNENLAYNGQGNDFAGFFAGRLHVQGLLSKSAGTFRIDHPLDPTNKYLCHSFIESPDMMNIYNGNITTDGNGEAIVNLPSYFEALNMDFKYQLTIIDQNNFAMARVSEKINGNKFKIKTSIPNIEVSWQITGIRQDPWAKAYRIQTEIEKPNGFKGYYMCPELYGKTEAFNEVPMLRSKYHFDQNNRKVKIDNTAPKPLSPMDVKQKIDEKHNTQKTK
jgi:hypothetical protein